MGRRRRELIRSLLVTADRLEAGADYQWGHMGSCNCGHLAQTVTGLPRRLIHQAALAREGDWDVQAREFCPTSGLLIDGIIAALRELGLSSRDITDLERLTNPAVRAHLPGGPRHLRRNHRDDVVAYLRAWAAMLETEADALPDVAAA